MKKSSNGNSLLYFVIALVCTLGTACVAFLAVKQTALGVLFGVLTIGLFVWWMVLRANKAKHVTAYYRSVIDQLTLPNSDLYNHFSLPVLMVKDRQIVWYNSLFRSAVLKGEDVNGELPEHLLPQSTRAMLDATGKGEVSVRDSFYTVYSSSYRERESTYTVLYFVDMTQSKALEQEYYDTRPVVAVLAVDSYEEITADLPDSVKAQFKGAIGREIEAFTAGHSGITKKLKNNRYLSIFDMRSLAAVRDTKLALLDKVRNLDLGTNIKATLSIGIGYGEPTLRQCEVIALQALEMAQGRGGDQAAIKTGDTYEFFGGVSGSGVEKRTKVRTRVVASALKELIKGSDRVFIMGHKYGDVDSLGSSYALWKCAVQMGKDAYLVVDETTHLATNLIAKIKQDCGSNILLNESQAKGLMTHQSLLIVCDTHRRDFVEYSALYDAAATTVVIDHHRKNVDFIENSVIFYHEPHASSACEMVAELLQYIDPSSIEKLQADALLAGIMLDTRNFVLRTGVRTFEASAFLRSRGADPVAVKKLFSDSIEIYRQRTALVSRSQFFGPFAVATSGQDITVSRVAASQAADELLNIEKIDASFVLFAAGENVNISARSLGKVNVQIIMEAMGGGGHHTMAATQLKNCTLDEAKTRLINILQQITEKDEVQ